MDKTVLTGEIITRLAGLSCPSCESLHYIKFGKVKGFQRFKCKKCSRTFGHTCNSPLYRIQKKEHLVKFITCLHNKMTVRSAAKQVGVSIRTSFEWRHKLLSSLNRVKHVEGDKTTIFIYTNTFSQKGSKKVSVKIPKKIYTLFRINPLGDIELNRITDGLQKKELHSIITKQSGQIIQYTKQRMLTAVLRKTGRTEDETEDKTQIADAKKQLTGELQKLQRWMKKFRGVASKYLSQYWAWYIAIRNSNAQIKGQERFQNKCLSRRQIKIFNNQKAMYKPQLIAR